MATWTLRAKWKKKNKMGNKDNGHKSSLTRVTSEYEDVVGLVEEKSDNQGKTCCDHMCSSIRCWHS